ncbi:hypothetical protein FT641_17965 [Bacillus paranthracis]|uniref:glucosaminidase domain-containing protein n=1 Tax=Bacillus paranthracis TaxID=2026186 RepID=UPI00187A0EAB|nr:glucosaminidase domain-containing protein [Bacillus paranthracis]MBE7114552.1 hypothetical protein [Bacillus paranthracis]MBE7154574.1 hypothetical protein [Bacillus paranthracis]
MRNKVLKLGMACLLFLLICVPSLLVPSPAMAEDWGSFNLMTKNSPGVTAEKINEVARSRGSDWLVIGESVMKASTETGINASFMIAQLVMESGWKYKSCMPKDAYNFGNIKGQGTAGSTHCSSGAYAKNNNADEGFRMYAEYIARYPKGTAPATDTHKAGEPLETIKKMLTVYAPESDGNNHAEYIATMKGIMTQLGQDYSGELAVGTGGGGVTPTKDGAQIKQPDGTVKEIKFWMEPKVGLGSSKGVTGSSDEFDGAMANAFSEGSKTANKWLVRSGVVLSACLLTYIAASVAMYVVAVNGYASGRVFEKMTGITDADYGKRTIMKLTARASLGIGIAAFFLTSMYVQAMHGIYSGVLKVVNIISG